MKEDIQAYSLEEFEVDSFITSLDCSEQAQILGGTWFQTTRELFKATVMNELYDAAKDAANAFFAWTVNTAPEFDTETEPGFFDTSYPCS